MPEAHFYTHSVLEACFGEGESEVLVLLERQVVLLSVGNDEQQDEEPDVEENLSDHRLHLLVQFRLPSSCDRLIPRQDVLEGHIWNNERCSACVGIRGQQFSSNLMLLSSGWL